MNVPPNYEYELKGEEGDQLVIKGISNKAAALKWIEEFSETSFITWRTYKIYPTNKRYQFKKIFRCHFNTSIIRKKDQRDLPTKRYSRNTDCPVTMTFCLSQPKDNNEVNCIAFFKGVHNHDIDTPSALLNRPLKEETKNAALELFSKGHLPGTAFITHKVLLMAKLGEQFSEIECDRSILPPRCRFNLIYNNEKYGPISEEERIKNLTSYLEYLNKNGCKSSLLKLQDEYIVAICTPIMLRAHLLPEVRNLLIVDVADHKDKMSGYCRSYLFSTYTTFGACVPLGCIITETSSIEAFQSGLQIFTRDFELFAYSPHYIMTNGDKRIDIILSNHFPTSKLLICTYHILRNMWNFLLARKNFFPLDARQTLYYQFKRLVYARSEEEFEEGKQDLLMSSEGYSQFEAYFSNLIDNRKCWAHCFLKNIKFRGHTSNHPVETVCRLFKDVPLRKIKSFTQAQLSDFLATAFNSYYTQKCVDAAAGNVTLQNLHITAPYTKVEEMLHNIYKVITPDDDQFEVDMTAGICTCVPGRYGKLCDHQLSIIHKNNIISEINNLDVESKTVFYHLANYKISKSAEIPENKIETPFLKNNIPLKHDIPEVTNVPDNSYSKESEISSTYIGRKKVSLDCIKSAQDALQEVFAELSEKLISDPIRMVPAVMKFQSNFKLCSSRKPKIIAGLYASFDEKQVEELRQARRRRRRKKLEKRLMEKEQNKQLDEEQEEVDINNSPNDLEDDDTLSAEEFDEKNKRIDQNKLKSDTTEQKMNNKVSEQLNTTLVNEEKKKEQQIENMDIDLSDNHLIEHQSDNQVELTTSETIAVHETEQLVEISTDDPQLLQSIASSSEHVYLLIDDNGYATVLDSGHEFVSQITNR